MNDMCDISTAMTPNNMVVNGAAYRPRGYQLEMLEKSQQQNIIVAVCGVFLPFYQELV